MSAYGRKQSYDSKAKSAAYGDKVKYGVSALVFLAGLHLTAPVVGHHSLAQFDMGRQVTIQGTVLEYEWKNPHVYFRVLETDDAGQAVEREIEGQGPSLLAPRGLTASSAKPGDVITLEANPHRRGGGPMNGLAVTLKDGTTIALGSVVPAAIAERTGLDRGLERSTADLSGVWLTQNGFFQQLFDQWSLSEKGEAAMASFDGSQIPQAECVPVASPRMMLWPVIHTVEVGKDIVTIRSDWMNSERTIYMDGLNYPENVKPALQGHSVGRWEEGALVVETTGFSEAAAGLTLGLPSGDQKTLTERFSLIEGGRQLRYEFTVGDPEYLEEPLRGAAYWNYRPDLNPSGIPCDPEVSSRFLTEG